jgi:hypothetical protein
MWKQLLERVRKEPAGDEAPLATPVATALPPEATPAPSLAPSPAQRYLIFPDELAELTEARPRAGRTARALRVVGYVALGALAAVGGLSLLAAPTPPPAPAAPATTGPEPESAAADHGTLADGVALAVGAFELRERMFASHQMQCSDLARGLVLLEQEWEAYSTAHTAARAALDSSGDAADRALYAKVDQVERRFERSGCARP